MEPNRKPPGIYYIYVYVVIVVQSLSHFWLFVTPGLQHARLPCPSQSPRACSNLCPLSWWFYLAISSSPPSSFPFNLHSIRVFSNDLTLHIRWPKYWSFSFNISPSNGYSRLTSFRINWSLAVQRTFMSLLQQHSLKASVLLGAQLSLWSKSHICIWLLEKP